MDLVEATADDVETLADYWYALATEMEPYSELNELVADDPGAFEDGIEQHHIEGENTTPYLLEVDDETVGYLLLRDGDHPSRELDSYLEVVDLFVEAGHRSQGNGSEAMATVRSLARERGADYLKVDCEWDNEGARRFYENNGFTEKQVTYVRDLD